MTAREFCEGGRANGAKGAVHVLLMAVSGACLAYNATALVYRRDKHLAVNACLYGALTAFEAYQVQRHWKQS